MKTYSHKIFKHHYVLNNSLIVNGLMGEATNSHNMNRHSLIKTSDPMERWTGKFLWKTTIT